MNAHDLLEQFIRQHNGKIPETAVNWKTSNSDISFIWGFNFLAVTDLWHATKDQRCLDMLTDAVDWLMTMTDENIDDYQEDVGEASKGPIKKMGLDLGYGASPRAELSPGWCRWIDIGNNNYAFRPEILTDGVIGYAVVSFINDCWDSIDQGKAKGWLKHFKRVFVYHDPSWSDDFEHSSGALLQADGKLKKHEGLRVAGYRWPDGVANDWYKTSPGLNQHCQFLMMGVMVENLLGEQFGAIEKLNLYIEKTLPHLVIYEDDRIFHLYDLRDNKNERSNDTGHQFHTNNLFRMAPEYGLLPVEYQDKIINQIVEKCHTEKGDMTVLMHGSDDHAGGSNSSHPSAHVWAECLLFKNGNRLLTIAKQTLDNEVKDAWSHKKAHFFARYFRAEAENKAIDAPTEPQVYLDEPTTEEPAATAAPQRGKDSEKQNKVASVADCSACPVSSGNKTVPVKIGKRTKLKMTKDYNASKGDYTFDDASLASVVGTWKHLSVTGIKAGTTTLNYPTNDGMKSVEIEVS